MNEVFVLALFPVGQAKMGAVRRRTYIPRNRSSTERDTENLHVVKLTSVLLGEVDRVNSQTGQGICFELNPVMMGRL